jgi:fatty-acyl-CoA synthase
MDVKVIDSDTGKDLPHGMDHSGEICLRGPQISESYLNNPAATEKSRMPADPKDPDQRVWCVFRCLCARHDWTNIIRFIFRYRSGDFGYLAGPSRLDGFVFLNRLGDSLRLRGFLTNPGEIEDLIKTHSAVLEAQVVGCPPTTTVGGITQASNTGDVAVAFVVIHEAQRAKVDQDALKAAIIALCKSKLANYKVPQEVFFVTEYPVTQAANGVKIQKHKLREMAQERGVVLNRGQGVSGPKVDARL